MTRGKLTRNGPFTVPPVNREVGAMHRPDSGKDTQLGHPDEAGVSQVHGPVGILCREIHHPGHSLARTNSGSMMRSPRDTNRSKPTGSIKKLPASPNPAPSSSNPATRTRRGSAGSRATSWPIMQKSTPWDASLVESVCRFLTISISGIAGGDFERGRSSSDAANRRSLGWHSRRQS